MTSVHADTATNGSVKISESSPPGLTTTAIKQAFAMPKGGAGYADTADGKSRTVFQVKDIIPAAAVTKDQSDKIAKELSGDLENEFLIAYIASLRDRLGVTINHAELNRATGAETGQ